MLARVGRMAVGRWGLSLYQKRERGGGEASWSRFKVNEFKAYFDNKVDSIDEQPLGIIQSLNQYSIDNATLQEKIHSYLKANETFYRLPATSKIHLLVALEMRANFPTHSLEKIRTTLLQHIIRHQTFDLSLDERALLILVRNLEIFRHKQHERLKWGNIKYLVVHLIHINFNAVPLSFLPYVVTLVVSEFRENSADIAKYSRFVDCLQERMHGVFTKMMDEELVDDEHRFVYSHEFIKELVEIYGTNGIARNEYAITLLRFITEKYIGKSLSSMDRIVSNCNVVYRNFPVEGVTEEGENCKLVLLQNIIKLYEGSKQIIEGGFDYKTSQYFCYSMLTHYFHLAYLSLPWQQSQGFTYLPSVQVKAPVLPSFFWKLYKENASYINGFPILKHTIKDGYPSYYIQTTVKGQQTIEPWMQTEMQIRVYDCLKKLNLPFTLQPFLCGRYIDFCLQGDILLQIDGDYHYTARELLTNEKTNYRNLHLLISGYRLVTLSIFEYNVCRQSSELMELISLKLGLISRGAILVQ